MSGPARCQCDNGDPCPNDLSEPKNVKCRPCALGWHRSVPCGGYKPEPIKHLVKTCAACGFDSAAHPVPVGAF